MQGILNTLTDFGLHPGNIIADGNIHRCHSGTGKKNLDGWYAVKLHNGAHYCYYGCWRRNEKGKCSSNGLNGSEDPYIWKILEDAQREEQDIREQEGRAKAADDLKDLPAAIDHPYLIKKKVQPHGILQKKTLLIIPAYAPGGTVNTYQMINSTGDKWFMAGGVVGGCCYPINGNESVVCVCEGFATGASINEATGYKVLVAFNAGNLDKVAREAVTRFPSSTVLICADNDHAKDRNTGLTAGKKAAEELGINCVWPTGIHGTDFNDMAVELGIDAVRNEIMQQETIEVMTPEDFAGESKSLPIAADMIPDGLIRQGIDALGGEILQYDLPLVLTVISRAIAGKIAFNGVWPNVFNIKVGGTSTGKTASDRRFLQCLDIDGFVSVNDIASGPGLLRAISKNPHGMGFFDEVTSLFRRSTCSHVDVVADGKSDALLDVFSRSGQSFTKFYGDNRNTITIDNPCFSMIGNATPVIFDSIQLKDFETGLMQRFDFWVYDGPILPKPLHSKESWQKIRTFIMNLRSLMTASPEQDTGNLAGLLQPCVFLGATNMAQSKIQEYSAYVIDAANKEDSAGLTGFISRKFDLAIKYALIHHAAVRGPDGLFEAIDDKDIGYGISIAELLGGWKINVLSGKVSSGDFHRDCEIFKDAIKKAIQNNYPKPTFKILATRRVQLKNWTAKYSESVIQVLKKRGEIITREGRKHTQYYLPKEHQQ